MSKVIVQIDVTTCQQLKTKCYESCPSAHIKGTCPMYGAYQKGIEEFVRLLKHDSSTWNDNLNTWEHCYTDTQLDELAERISE